MSRHRWSRRTAACLVLPWIASCYVVPENARPEVAFGMDIASEFHFRGMTNVEAPVLQTESAVTLPTRLESGSITGRAFANWDLENDTGDAWFPDGHAGEPSQVDLMLAYTERYRGFDLTTGIISYALQNPDDFVRAPDGERGETKELFFIATRPLKWDIVPRVQAHYDFDEVSGWYFVAAVQRAFPIDEKLSVDGEISIAYADEKQSDWLYGLKESGLADLHLKAELHYLLDANTTLRLGANYARVMDDDIADWFEDDIDIDPDTVWASLGVVWAY